MNYYKFSCPLCNQNIEAQEDMLGSVVDCPTCNKPMQLPLQPFDTPPTTDQRIETSSNTDQTAPQQSEWGKNRVIRVFISSTFNDMMEERNELMAHTWPQLRKLCQERQVEFIEVDLRWGVTKEQSTRKETLKLCLEEIRACRPYFIGMLGERYGWTPGAEAYTDALNTEEQWNWLRKLKDRSVTELEIWHGVLNNPENATRALFYFRDPGYAHARGKEYLSETPSNNDKQNALKEQIRAFCRLNKIPLTENYATPRELADIVLKQLSEAIDLQFPITERPDPLTCEAQNHESYAESRRHTYIGRSDYYQRLDQHAAGDGTPLVLFGASGSGKSALLANWVVLYRKDHPLDFVFQHYTGCSADSSDYISLIARLMGEIKRWTRDPEELPFKPEDIIRDLTLWLAKARSKAQLEGVRCIVVLDALNQIAETGNTQPLVWLPEIPFSGPMRLFASSLPDQAHKIANERKWSTLSVEPLATNEKEKMIDHYLLRFGKKLEEHRKTHLAASPQTSNPLFLKILLDELRVTATFDLLDKQLEDYLKAADIPVLLQMVLTRYQRDYDHDRKGLVEDTLGMILAARRGLSESELLQLLRSSDLPQLPQAVWAPFRAAIDELLLNRGGVFTFAHDYIRSAVAKTFIQDQDTLSNIRNRLANFFENQPPTFRTCDELPWLLNQINATLRLQTCLLDFDRFLQIKTREGQDGTEIIDYWNKIRDLHTLEKSYLDSFEKWQHNASDERVSRGASTLAIFLYKLDFYNSAEMLYRRVLAIDERMFGHNDPSVAILLNNIASLIQIRDTSRLDEAEELSRRALTIDETIFGPDDPKISIRLNTLATILQKNKHLKEAEKLLRRALTIDEKYFGANHPTVATDLNNLGGVLHEDHRLTEAESLFRRALAIDERHFGINHPKAALCLFNLAMLLADSNRWDDAGPLMRQSINSIETTFGGEHPKVAMYLSIAAVRLLDGGYINEAEPFMRRVLIIQEKEFGVDHPNILPSLDALSKLLQDSKRPNDAEPLCRRALIIANKHFEADHITIANAQSNLGAVLFATRQFNEAEPLMRQALLSYEKKLGSEHQAVAAVLNNLAVLLKDTNHTSEAELLLRRVLVINEKRFGPDNPQIAVSLNNLSKVLNDANKLDEAESLARKALAIDENYFGPDHPKVASRLNSLFCLLSETGRALEIEPLLQRKLDIHLKLAKTKGGFKDDIKQDVDDYVTYLSKSGKTDSEIRQTLNSIYTKYGMRTSHSKQTEANPLASCQSMLQEMGNTLDPSKVVEIAERLLPKVKEMVKGANCPNKHDMELIFRRSIEMSEQMFGVDNPAVASGLDRLADFLMSCNRLNEAEPLMKRALSINEMHYGADHQIIVSSLDRLVKLLLKTNRLSEAESLKRRSLEVLLKLSKTDGVPYDRVQIAINNYAALLQAQGRLDDDIHANLKALLQPYGMIVGSTSTKGLSINSRNQQSPSNAGIETVQPLPPVASGLIIREPGKRRSFFGSFFGCKKSPLLPTPMLSETERLNKNATETSLHTEPTNSQTNTSINRKVSLNEVSDLVAIGNVANMSLRAGNYKEAEDMMLHVVMGFLKISTTNNTLHPNLGTAIGNYTACLLKNQNNSSKAFEEKTAAIYTRFCKQYPELSKNALSFMQAAIHSTIFSTRAKIASERNK
jgi:tetratricopeptide (TPR) repeat protein